MIISNCAKREYVFTDYRLRKFEIVITLLVPKVISSLALDIVDGDPSLLYKKHLWSTLLDNKKKSVWRHDKQREDRSFRSDQSDRTQRRTRHTGSPFLIEEAVLIDRGVFDAKWHQVDLKLYKI